MELAERVETTGLSRPEASMLRSKRPLFRLEMNPASSRLVTMARAGQTRSGVGWLVLGKSPLYDVKDFHVRLIRSCDRRGDPDETWVSSGERLQMLRGVEQRLGGARRDRTDDLKLAKLALSQLSYGP